MNAGKTAVTAKTAQGYRTGTQDGNNLDRMGQEKWLPRVTEIECCKNQRDEC